VDFYEAILADGAFMDYPIWVRSTKHHPSVKYGSRPWHFWQYQSDGSIAGISGHVDRDAFFGSKSEWEAFLREPNGRTPGVQQALSQQLAASQAQAPQPAAAPPAAPEPVEQQPPAQQAAAPEPADQQSSAEQASDEQASAQQPDKQQ
ncbi:MAG: GH25 family lysozyme, partial [Roseiarcus sp.]|uniref:GH25 family lysozyme n=1 Tax=Roseiarcus sp. TaxID=1969460 RepID=UPI003BAE17F9